MKLLKQTGSCKIFLWLFLGENNFCTTNPDNGKQTAVNLDEESAEGPIKEKQANQLQKTQRLAKIQQMSLRF